MVKGMDPDSPIASACDIPAYRHVTGAAIVALTMTKVMSETLATRYGTPPARRSLAPAPAIATNGPRMMTIPALRRQKLISHSCHAGTRRKGGSQLTKLVVPSVLHKR